MARTNVDRILDAFLKLSPAEVDAFAQRLCIRDLDSAKTLEKALSEVEIC